MDIKKLYDKFNKRWIGALYGYAIFLIFCSFGAIIGIALGLESIYFWVLLLVIGYAFALPIGFIRDYIKKRYKKEELNNESIN